MLILRVEGVSMNFETFYVVTLYIYSAVAQEGIDVYKWSGVRVLAYLVHLSIPKA